MKITEKVRNAMRNFLRITESQNNSITIQEGLNYEANAAKNRIWYRGDSYELEQLYKQIPNTNCSFWGSVPTKGMEIRKIHTGLPKLIINTLVNIVHNDLNNISIGEDEEKAKVWEEIYKDNKMKNLLKKATKDVLVIGDGAFKISFDGSITKYPIVEFYSGEKIDIVYDRGRMREVVFYTEYIHNKHSYILHEFYGFGYVNYKLFKDDKEVSISAIPQTEELKDVTFDGNYCMAVPYMIFESDKWEGRGQSILDGKTDNLDSFDETWSQWIDALRAGRAKTYIPESLIPRSPDTGEILKPSYFDNRYIKTDSYMGEKADPKIDTEQPGIPTESYIQTYVTALDLCLQGIISPSTLGIDNKKLDNAEAQREKEKTTLYTRDSIIEALNDVIPLLVDVILKSNNTWNKQRAEDNEVTIVFGEYASPSFEAVVETVGKAKSYSIMSVEQCVEEMYGDTWTKEEKVEEIQRIKEQSGLMTAEEPKVIDDEDIENPEDVDLDGQEE